MFLTPFLQKLKSKISDNGGLFNAHMHLDRAGTSYCIQEKHFETLNEKHARISDLHGLREYEEANIVKRIEPYARYIESIGTTRADTFVDVSSKIGLSAIRAMRQIKREVAFDLRIGAYSPMGFRCGDQEFMRIFRDAVEQSDFIGCLPERDEAADYPDHIGFEAHCETMLNMGAEFGIPVHIHADQKNIPGEYGVQRVLNVVESVATLPPEVWIIHAISLSAEGDSFFYRACERLVASKIGIICCPSAALSMVQHRGYLSPTHNSIARVLDLCRAGVDVRIGCDNIADIFLPATSPDMIFEILTLANAVRCYDVDLLARLASTRAAPIPKL